MQKFVHQRAGQVLHPFTIRWIKMGESFERPFQLGGHQVVDPGGQREAGAGRRRGVLDRAQCRDLGQPPGGEARAQVVGRHPEGHGLS